MDPCKKKWILPTEYTPWNWQQKHMKMDSWNKTSFLLGWPIFRDELLVLGSVCIFFVAGTSFTFDLKNYVSKSDKQIPWKKIHGSFQVPFYTWRMLASAWCYSQKQNVSIIVASSNQYIYLQPKMTFVLCFEWKGPSAGVFKPLNRRQTGSRWMYRYKLCMCKYIYINIDMYISITYMLYSHFTGCFLSLH